MSKRVDAQVGYRRDNWPVDRVNIDEALAGRMPVLNKNERRLVVKILHERGWSACKIAKHLGTTDRTVQRHQTRLRELRLI